MTWVYVLAALIVLLVFVTLWRKRPDGEKARFPWFWIALPVFLFSFMFAIQQAGALWATTESPSRYADYLPFDGMESPNTTHYQGLAEVLAWSDESRFMLMSIAITVAAVAFVGAVWSWRKKRYWNFWDTASPMVGFHLGSCERRWARCETLELPIGVQWSL